MVEYKVKAQQPVKHQNLGTVPETRLLFAEIDHLLTYVDGFNQILPTQA